MDESSIDIQSTNRTNFSLTQKQILDITSKTNTTINKIQKILDKLWWCKIGIAGEDFSN